MSGIALIIAGCPYGFHLGETATNLAAINSTLEWKEDLLVNEDLAMTFTLDTNFDSLQISEFSIGIIDSIGYFNSFYSKQPDYCYLLDSIAYGDGVAHAFEVSDTTGLSNGDVIWIGNEAIQINVTDGTHLTIVAREYYNSIKEFHVETADSTFDYVACWFSFIGFDNRICQLYRDGELIYKGCIAPGVGYNSGVISMNILSLAAILQEPLFLKRDIHPILQGFHLGMRYPGDTWRFTADAGTVISVTFTHNVGGYATHTDLANGINADYQALMPDDFNLTIQQTVDGYYMITCYDDGTSGSHALEIAESSPLRFLGFDAGTHDTPVIAQRQPARYGMLIDEQDVTEYQLDYLQDRNFALYEHFIFTYDEDWYVMRVESLSGSSVYFSVIEKGNNNRYIHMNTDESEGIEYCYYYRGYMKGLLEEMIDAEFLSLYKPLEHITDSDIDADSFELLDAGLPPRLYIIKAGDNIYDWIANEAKFSNNYLHITGTQFGIKPILQAGITETLQESWGDEPTIEIAEPLNEIVYNVNFDWGKNEFQKPTFNVILKDACYNRGLYIRNKQTIDFKGFTCDWNVIKNVIQEQGANRLGLLGRQAYIVTLEALEDFEIGTYVSITGILSNIIPFTTGVIIAKEGQLIGHQKYTVWIPRISSASWAPCCYITAYNAVTGVATCTDIDLYSNAAENYTDLTYLDPDYWGQSTLPCYVLQSTLASITQTISSIDETAKTLQLDSGGNVLLPPCFLSYTYWTTMSSYILQDVFVFICDDDDYMIQDDIEGYQLI